MKSYNKTSYLLIFVQIHHPRWPKFPLQDGNKGVLKGSVRVSYSHPLSLCMLCIPKYISDEIRLVINNYCFYICNILNIFKAFFSTYMKTISCTQLQNMFLPTFNCGWALTLSLWQFHKMPVLPLSQGNNIKSQCYVSPPIITKHFTYKRQKY